MKNKELNNYFTTNHTNLTNLLSAIKAVVRVVRVGSWLKFGINSLIFILTFTSCSKNVDNLRIGHSGGYLSAALYAATEVASQNFTADYQQFRQSSDIAYSLLTGTLDAGFVDTERLAAFAALDGFDRLTVVGKVSYPYGSTLILRKGLNLRLHELNGLKIAASEPHCKLLEEFIADARRLNADLSNVEFVYMPFHAMLSALEARVVDAAIIRGSYAVIALHEGHSILYQNWEVEPGDECCPAIVDQAVLVLLARRDKLEAVTPFVNALVRAQELSPDELRHAVANNSVIPFELLQGQPVPEFSVADDELIEIFIESANEHLNEGHVNLFYHEHLDDEHINFSYHTNLTHLKLSKNALYKSGVFDTVRVGLCWFVVKNSYGVSYYERT